MNPYRNVGVFLCNINYYLRYIDMKVLTTSASAQTFKIIPREYATTATMLITDDSTNTTTTYASITPTVSTNHLQISQAFSPVLKEGRFYDLVLKNTSNKIIYKDKIFCTVQGVDQTQNEEYTVNKDVYTSDTSYDNDFIIL
jgi:hypothetical protein